MASSDDELEVLPHSVSDYHFEDENQEPISFSVLPLQWDDNDVLDGVKMEIFLRGCVDDGLSKIYKPVTAWKFNLTEDSPAVSVMSKENRWIQLQKPRKGFETEIRSILITLNVLHFLRRDSESSAKLIWDHVSNIFSHFDVRPSHDDIVDHSSLIVEAVKKDSILSKSQFLQSFILENPQTKKTDETDHSPNTEFIDDDDGDLNAHMLDEDFDDGIDGSEEEEPFDSVCAICDNGGDLLCCDGMCLRSFHATKEAGLESDCVSLGFTADQVESMEMSTFFCKNCEEKKHQCFSCGRLGSSDDKADPEVFRCVNATCGRFYHPRCVAKHLHRNDAASASKLEESIASGEQFTCPIHKCRVCDKYEDKKEHDLQFAVCRRCPRSYHRKCLPKKIAFEDDSEDEDIIQRAWEDLLPNRILIYCLKHEIDEELGTPVRDHIKFSSVEHKKILSSSQRREKMAPKRSISEDDSASEKSFTKTLKRPDKTLLSSKEAVKPGSSSLVRSKKPGSSLAISSLKKVERSKFEDTGPSLGDRLYDVMFKGSAQAKPKKQFSEEADVKLRAVTKDPLMRPVVKLDAVSENQILALIKESSSAITLKEVIQSHKPPSTYNTSCRGLDSSITQGRIEGSVQALLTALKKIDMGSSVEDAKAVCEPGVLQKMTQWKSKLIVYLAPFLHGMRYTSFGRHFTKVEKLKEIVDKLHWYAQDDDMIVDFCCGANDFSLMMKKKLEEVGKKCQYKNFDILKPKNDFNFEQRDWMTVKPSELPNGSKMIMGLNPPFGLKAALANQFVSKAASFCPKIIILIVPPETRRLERNEPPYELTWEDNATLSGKSFYFPGSLSIEDKQVDQWNAVAPVLLLWSRSDFAPQHAAIAQRCGHVSRVDPLPGPRPGSKTSKKMLSSLYPADDAPPRKPSPTPLPTEQQQNAGHLKRPVSGRGDQRESKRARPEGGRASPAGLPAPEVGADVEGGEVDEPMRWRKRREERRYGEDEGALEEAKRRYGLSGPDRFGSDGGAHRRASGSPAGEGFGWHGAGEEEALSSYRRVLGEAGAAAGGGNYRLGGGGGSEERYGGLGSSAYGPLLGSSPAFGPSGFGGSGLGGSGLYGGRASGTAMQRYAPQLDEMNPSQGAGETGRGGPGVGRYGGGFPHGY